MRGWAIAALGALALFSALPAAAQQTAEQAFARVTDPAQMPRVFAVRVTVSDLDRAERFYREGLGATDVRRVHDRERVAIFPHGTSVVLVQGAQRAANAPASQGAGGFILQVSDIDATVARIAPAGGTVERPPNSGQGELSFNTRAAQIRDPDGVGIEIIQFATAAPRQQ